MMQPYKQPSQDSSEKSPSSHSYQLLHHVLNNVLKISQDERVFSSKWIEYNDYHYNHEQCDGLQFKLKHIHDYSDYIVDGQHCALKFATRNKIKSFVSCMSTRRKENTFQYFSVSF